VPQGWFFFGWFQYKTCFMVRLKNTLKSYMKCYIQRGLMELGNGIHISMDCTTLLRLSWTFCTKFRVAKRYLTIPYSAQPSRTALSCDTAH